MKKATIGSISHGTLRSEDLVQTFADTLESLASQEGDRKHDELLLNAREWLRQGLAGRVGGGHERDGLEFTEELSNALQEFAPPYCYFGANEGDGSDFGFWPDMFALDCDCADGEVLPVRDLSQVPDSWEGPVWLVNDHGNGTLYMPERTYREAWSIV